MGFLPVICIHSTSFHNGNKNTEKCIVLRKQLARGGIKKQREGMFRIIKVESRGVQW